VALHNAKRRGGGRKQKSENMEEQDTAHDGAMHPPSSSLHTLNTTESPNIYNGVDDEVAVIRPEQANESTEESPPLHSSKVSGEESNCHVLRDGASAELTGDLEAKQSGEQLVSINGGGDNGLKATELTEGIQETAPEANGLQAQEHVENVTLKVSTPQVDDGSPSTPFQNQELDMYRTSTETHSAKKAQSGRKKNPRIDPNLSAEERKALLASRRREKKMTVSSSKPLGRKSKRLLQVADNPEEDFQGIVGSEAAADVMGLQNVEGFVGAIQGQAHPSHDSGLLQNRGEPSMFPQLGMGNSRQSMSSQLQPQDDGSPAVPLSNHEVELTVNEAHEVGEMADSERSDSTYQAGNVHGAPEVLGQHSETSNSHKKHLGGISNGPASDLRRALTPASRMNAPSSEDCSTVTTPSSNLRGFVQTDALQGPVTFHQKSQENQHHHRSLRGNTSSQEQKLLDRTSLISGRQKITGTWAKSPADHRAAAKENGEFVAHEPNLERNSRPHTTTFERWTQDEQDTKVRLEYQWVQRQKKMEEKITVRFHDLKDTVSSSEDVFTKTKSVIELKKLQLLQLQRRLRRDFLHDFFKPFVPTAATLRTMKKNRAGKRLRQLEKLEGKQKEERQRRSRERQREFFKEVEVHK
jgi:hypothetical protein